MKLRKKMEESGLRLRGQIFVEKIGKIFVLSHKGRMTHVM